MKSDYGIQLEIYSTQNSINLTISKLCDVIDLLRYFKITLQLSGYTNSDMSYDVRFKVLTGGEY